MKIHGGKALRGLLFLIAGLAGIFCTTGWAMTQSLNLPFAFDQRDISYLVFGQIDQILDPAARLGRDYIVFPGYLPVLMIAEFSKLFYATPEATQTIIRFFNLMVIWGAVTFLIGNVVALVINRWLAGLWSILAASLVMMLTPLGITASNDLQPLTSLLALTILPIAFALLRSRFFLLAGVGLLPCLLWSPVEGLAVAAVLGMMIVVHLYRRPFRLIATIMIGFILSILGVGLVTGGTLIDYISRTLPFFYENFWLNGPYGVEDRYWHFGTAMMKIWARDGLIWGALLISLAVMIVRRPRINVLLAIHIALMASGYGQEYFGTISADWLLPARLSAVGLLAFTGLFSGLFFGAPTIKWRNMIGYGGATIMAIAALMIMMNTQPAQFNRAEAKDRAKCLFHGNCPKPVADRSAELIQAYERLFGFSNIPNNQRVIAAYPTWINTILMARHNTLPTTWAAQAMGRNRNQWLDALATQPFQMALTEAPGIFPTQPFMVHSLWWLYRDIARLMVPIHNDYRFVFWQRRNQIDLFRPSRISCSIIPGNDGRKILIPAHDKSIEGDKDTIYELHIEWQLAQPATGRFLVVADKPGLFTESGGFGLNPYINQAIIPLRNLSDFVVLGAFQDQPLALNVTACDLWQVSASDAAAALFE